MLAKALASETSPTAAAAAADVPAPRASARRLVPIAILATAVLAYTGYRVWD